MAQQTSRASNKTKAKSTTVNKPKTTTTGSDNSSKEETTTSTVNTAETDNSTIDTKSIEAKSEEKDTNPNDATMSADTGDKSSEPDSDGVESDDSSSLDGDGDNTSDREAPEESSELTGEFAPDPLMDNITNAVDGYVDYITGKVTRSAAAANTAHINLYSMMMTCIKQNEAGRMISGLGHLRDLITTHKDSLPSKYWLLGSDYISNKDKRAVYEALVVVLFNMTLGNANNRRLAVKTDMARLFSPIQLRSDMVERFAAYVKRYATSG